MGHCHQLIHFEAAFPIPSYIFLHAHCVHLIFVNLYIISGYFGSDNTGTAINSLIWTQNQMDVYWTCIISKDLCVIIWLEKERVPMTNSVQGFASLFSSTYRLSLSSCSLMCSSLLQTVSLQFFYYFNVRFCLCDYLYIFFIGQLSPSLPFASSFVVSSLFKYSSETLLNLGDIWL